MNHKHHRKDAPKFVKCTVVTVSDSRTMEDDESGKILKEVLTNAGHEINDYTIIKDDLDIISKTVGSILDTETDVLFTNGGTGISRRDVTVEAVKPLIEKDLPGFGEIFRQISFDEIGMPAALSRAFAATARGKLIVCLPGSKNAVRAGVNLILPELGHFVWEVRK